MCKIISTLLGLLIFINSFGQTKNFTSFYFEPELSKTIKDRTKENNPLAIGLGFQSVFATQKVFSPTLELIGDAFPGDDKVYRTNADGSEKKRISFILKFYAGTNLSLYKSFYLSTVLGPTLINGQVLLGLKPSLGLFFPKSKKWTTKLSYENIFNRNSGQKENFTALNFSVGIKLN